MFTDVGSGFPNIHSTSPNSVGPKMLDDIGLRMIHIVVDKYLLSMGSIPVQVIKTRPSRAKSFSISVDICAE